MRFERGLCFGIRNADRADEGIGLGPVENLDAAADARLAAERKTDLAADIGRLGSFDLAFFFFLGFLERREFRVLRRVLSKGRIWCSCTYRKLGETVACCG